MANYVIADSWWRTIVPVLFGDEQCSPGHLYGPAVRDYYLLHFIFSGEGDYYRGGTGYHLTSGDLFVIRPGEVTTYQASTTAPWHYCWAGFSADSVPDFLNFPVLRQMPVRRIFEHISELIPGRSDGHAFSLIFELLWKLTEANSGSIQRPSNYAAYAKTYLDANYMTSVSIQALANTLHIDRRYLTAQFRQAYGQPPQAYLMELRLDRAREFLLTGYSVTETAAMTGFPDLPGFSRQYKARFGISPSRQHAAP